MGRKIALSIWRYSPNYNGVIRPPVMFLLCLVDNAYMILQDKLEWPYEFYAIRSKLWFKCDYCGKDFERVKKSRERLNRIVDKDSCGGKECSRKKTEESFLSKYGVKNVFETSTFKEKQAATNERKYGTKEYFSSEDFQQKRCSTLNAVYGVSSPLQSAEIRQRQQQTCEERYGVDNYAKTEEFLEKRNQTFLENYGTTNVPALPQIQEARRETCQKKYGKDYYTQTDEHKLRKKATCLETYGVDHTSKLPENREQARETIRDRYGVDSYSQTDEFKDRMVKTCTERYGVPNPLCLRENQVYGKTQAEIGQWLNSFGFSFEPDFKLLNGQELDLFDRNVGVAVEYCGLYWHNENSPQPRNKEYHYKKYLRCREKGVTLITLFEDEWHHHREKCQNVMRSLLGRFDARIYARCCKLEPVDKKTFLNFCNKFHLQGASRGSQSRFGLYSNDELVGVLSLGRHHRQTSEPDSIILDRLCFKPGLQVVGGASRLFKHARDWAKESGYSKIITWSDNRWSPGQVYERLGFSLETELSPDYGYVFLPKKQRLSKQSQKKSAVDCPPDKTELEWATERGLYRIWDCGKKRWRFDL